MSERAFARLHAVLGYLHGRDRFRPPVDGCGERLPLQLSVWLPAADGESTRAFNPVSLFKAVRCRVSAYLEDSPKEGPCADRKRLWGRW